MRRRKHSLAALLTLVAVAGCSGGARPRIAPAAPASGARPDQAVLWLRDSAEYVVALRQTYRLAGHALEALAPSLEPGTWAVSFDADETLMSNLGYSLRRVEHGGLWTQESWSEWVQDRQATPLPGAFEFVETVHRLGGKVAIVTNRSQATCAATRENLDALGLRYDTILCKAGDSSKEARWRAVEAGEGTGLEPLEIVMWIGDNILDFPGLSQDRTKVGDDALEAFGARYFLLPNPVYGSWEEER